MPGWLNIALYVVMNAPRLVSLVQQAIELFQNAPKVEQDSVKQMLGHAIEEHKKNQDDAKLEKVCTGFACPPKLVKDI